MPRILIADDHALVRRFVSSIIAENGWEVCGEASNGRQAVAMTAELAPDIVVLDLSMPEMNGLDAAREIHAQSPQSIIFVLTMHDAPELIIEARARGVRRCVLKSDIQHLIDAIQHEIQPNPELSNDSCNSDSGNRTASDRETKGGKVPAGVGREHTLQSTSR